MGWGSRQVVVFFKVAVVQFDVIAALKEGTECLFGCGDVGGLLGRITYSVVVEIYIFDAGFGQGVSGFAV